MNVPMMNGSASQQRSYTPIDLKRWSCQEQQLPAVSRIKSIHVYDFDNTLFMSPLPNPKLWNQATVGKLQTQDCFGQGGWWHDERILAATGEGLEKEEPRAWEGWWNEQVAALVRLSMEQDEALTVLLTGRGESNFADLIKRMVTSKKLSFDMLCLKPKAGPNGQRFSSTMNYKQSLFTELLNTYKEANELKVYEDRPRHTLAFREFFKVMNTELQYSTSPVRKPFTADVVQVTDQATTLDPIIEAAEVQRLINAHNLSTPPPPRNLEIKKNVSFTGYMVSNTEIPRLLSLVNNIPGMINGNIKFMANNVLISYGEATPSVLTKVGGIGHKQDWQITSLGVYQNTIWAAKVAPIPPVSIVHTESRVPLIILAQKNGAPLSQATRIQQWQPVPPDKSYIFQTVVREKAQLWVDYESDGSEHDAVLDHNDRKSLKRPHSPDTRMVSSKGGPGFEENKRMGAGNQNRARGGAASSGRGGTPNNRNNTRRGGQGGNSARAGAAANRRGGGSQRGYKSLDDMGTNGNNRYQRGEPTYDDYMPPGAAGYKTAFPALGGNDGAGDGGGMNY